MRRRISFAPGEYYHIYSRGVEKRDIFLDESDFRRFVRLLYVCNSQKPVVSKTIQGRSLEEIDRGTRSVSIGAYVLMPNHVHLLVREEEECGTSSFMRKLLTAYVMYFNTKYERSGVLFQGRYQAKHAHSDTYLKYLYAYIHLNPVKLVEPSWREEGIKDRERVFAFLQSYLFSSYLDYLGERREERIILEPSAFPDYYQTAVSHRGELEEWLSYVIPDSE